MVQLGVEIGRRSERQLNIAWLADKHLGQTIPFGSNSFHERLDVAFGYVFSSLGLMFCATTASKIKRKTCFSHSCASNFSSE